MIWLVLIRTPFEEMVRDYKFTEREALQYLIKLDRLKVIELQPGNRVRLLRPWNYSGFAQFDRNPPAASSR